MPNNLMYAMDHNSVHKIGTDQPTTESLEYQAMRNENETLRTRLENKTFEVAKLRNKTQFLAGELDLYKQLVNQIRTQFATCNGNQHAINIALENANATLTEISKRKLTRTKKIKPGSSASNCSCCSAMEKPYACDWLNCGKRFRQKTHLDQHKNVHTGQRFICEFANCGKSFARKFNLQEHRKLHNAHNPNICNYPDCAQVFSTKYGLARHQNAQHNLNL